MKILVSEALIYKSCSPQACNLFKKETPTKMFSCEFCKIF